MLKNRFAGYAKRLRINGRLPDKGAWDPFRQSLLISLLITIMSINLGSIVLRTVEHRFGLLFRARTSTRTLKLKVDALRAAYQSFSNSISLWETVLLSSSFSKLQSFASFLSRSFCCSIFVLRLLEVPISRTCLTLVPHMKYSNRIKAHVVISTTM